jgi:hypothetical protein
MSGRCRQLAGLFWFSKPLNQPVNKLWIKSMLAGRNDGQSGRAAVSSEGLLATMEAQQAVAIPFVGRRVTVSTCLFFSFSTALRAPISLRD